MSPQNTINFIANNLVQEMKFRLYRPLKERFKPNFAYELPFSNGKLELDITNPLNLPVSSFANIIIQFEYEALMSGLNFLFNNKCVYSVSLPTQMRYITDEKDIDDLIVENGTLDIFIIETAHKDPYTGIEMQNDYVQAVFSFITPHNNVKYSYNINMNDLVAAATVAYKNKDFE